MGILTLAVVTIPFRFEGQRHIERAINGLQDLRNNVDAILVIANEQIKNQYGNMALRKAFSTADQVIATAIDGISSAVLRSVQVNTDMADMRTTLERSGDMMMGVGLAEGPDRAILAVRDALDSPLFIEHDMHQAQRIIVSYSYSDPQYEISMDEMSIVNEELETNWDCLTKFGASPSTLHWARRCASHWWLPDLRLFPTTSYARFQWAMASNRHRQWRRRNKHSPDLHNLPTRV